MAKRELLMLAHNFERNKRGVGGWFVSEKLDGLRCFWDGGITRGIPAREVPWANVEKDFRYRNEVYSTGLWSRYGKAIQAPDWWLNELPSIPLDGELWEGVGKFQHTTSVVKDLIPGIGWSNIKLMVFDSPAFENIFADGVIDYKSHKKSLLAVDNWARARGASSLSPSIFEFNYNKLRAMDCWNQYCCLLKQTKLPPYTHECNLILNQMMDEVMAAGGEGLMLRRPESVWTPQRSYDLLKMKQWLDSEAIVVGYVWGRKTDRGSKLLGLMGALIVSWNNKIFELSGFTDQERQITFPSGNSAADIGRLHPGQRVTGDLINLKFPIGSIVTFRFRELTDSGIPKEARYYRKAVSL